MHNFTRSIVLLTVLKSLMPQYFSTLLKPGSVSVRQCVSFIARGRSIKDNFIGRVRAMKMAYGRTPRRAAGEGVLKKILSHL